MNKDNLYNIDWHKTLVTNNYYCTKQFANLVKVAMCTSPTGGCFLYGPAGTGKTFLPEVVKNILKTQLGGCNYFFFQCTAGTREEDLLSKILPDEDTKSGMKLHDGIILQATKATLNNPNAMTLVVIDEWDKTRPSADAFLLDFLQYGRINFNGNELTADLSKMVFMITMNDERELSEPLIRRLPKIDFELLPVEIVKKAIESTHSGNSNIDSVLQLYQMCCASEMSKPCTIQELRQLLDAFDMLGSDSDWDSLVYQFVTKTPENHLYLKATEKKGDWKKQVDKSQEKLNASAYKEGVVQQSGKKIETLNMPNIAVKRGLNLRPIPKRTLEEAAAKNEVHGAIVKTDELYDSFVGKVQHANTDGVYLGDELEVIDNYIAIIKPISIIDFEKVESLWGKEGEVVFSAPKATLEDVFILRKFGLQITNYSTTETYGVAHGITVAWNLEEGATVYVNLLNKTEFYKLFGIDNSVDTNGDKWLNRNKPLKHFLELASKPETKGYYGRMFHRHMAPFIESAPVQQQQEEPNKDVSAKKINPILNQLANNYKAAGNGDIRFKRDIVTGEIGAVFSNEKATAL